MERDHEDGWRARACKAISRRIARLSSGRGRARSKCARRDQLAQCDGLIIPGGESTTMLKLLDIENLTEPVRRLAREKPIYGTCAGAILLAHEVTHPAQASLDLMDIAVERNGYGRQIDSRIAKIDWWMAAASSRRCLFARRLSGTWAQGARVLATYRGRSGVGGAGAAHGDDVSSGVDGGFAGASAVCGEVVGSK